MLRRATEAVTSSRPRTAEAVRAMPITDLRRDPVLEAAFQRGWDEAKSTIHQALQGTPGSAKRSRPSGQQTRPAPTTSLPKPSPAPRRTTAKVEHRVPPLPSGWSQVERTRALSFDPRAGHHPPGATGRGRQSTSRGAMKHAVEHGPPGTSGNRETAVKPTDTTSRVSQRKYERYLRFREEDRKKRTRRACPQSQQHRLAKTPETTTTSTSTNTSGEAMEVDCVGTGTAATPDNTQVATGEDTSGRDVEDIYLEAPPPTLPTLEEDEDQPFFRETPPSSPGQQ